MPAVEAAIGILLVTTVVATFAVGVPDADQQRVQLDAYATDAGRLLAGDPPQHVAQTRLAEVAADEETFEREKAVLRRRLDRILPANLLYQVQTPHGLIGVRQPPGVTVGSDTVYTVAGPVTIRVWYA
jgi:hypothetical protein